MRPQQSSPGLLAVGRFVKLYTLLSRYADLILLLTMEYPSEHRKDDACLICLDDNSPMVVLSCSHHLCVKCSKRWVSKKLQCPFCRQSFSRWQVTKSQWELLQWNPDDVKRDVRWMQERLVEFLSTIDFTGPATGLDGYLTQGRMIREEDNDDGAVMVDET